MPQPLYSGSTSRWSTALAWSRACSPAEASGKKPRDRDDRRRRGERGDPRVGPEHLGVTVTPAKRRRRIGDRLSVYFEHPVHQVEDPVVRQARAGVHATLVLPVDAEARYRHLDCQNRARWVGPAIVVQAAGNDGNIGLGLGFG